MPQNKDEVCIDIDPASIIHHWRHGIVFLQRGDLVKGLYQTWQRLV